jgi:hypothetical protein
MKVSKFLSALVLALAGFTAGNGFSQEITSIGASLGSYETVPALKYSLSQEQIAKQNENWVGMQSGNLSLGVSNDGNYRAMVAGSLSYMTGFSNAVMDKVSMEVYSQSNQGTYAMAAMKFPAFSMADVVVADVQAPGGNQRFVAGADVKWNANHSLVLWYPKSSYGDVGQSAIAVRNYVAGLAEVDLFYKWTDSAGTLSYHNEQLGYGLSFDAWKLKFGYHVVPFYNGGSEAMTEMDVSFHAPL